MVLDGAPESRPDGSGLQGEEPASENRFTPPQSLLDRLLELDLTWATPILAAIFPARKGRPRHPPVAMLKALIYQRVKQIPSWRQLAKHIQTDKTGLAKKLGFSQPPHHSAFSTFTTRLGPEGVHALFEEFVKQLRARILAEDVGFVEELAIDSTLVRAFCKTPQRGRRKSDPDAKWGVQGELYGKPIYVHGYKLHLACDADRDLPVSYSVHSANRNDSPLFRPEIGRVIKEGLSPEMIIADAGYDSRLNNLFCCNEAVKAVPLIALNPRRTKGKARLKRKSDELLPFKRNSDEWKEHYAKRPSIERVISRLKCEFLLTTLKLRRLRRVAVHFGLCLIALETGALAAYANDRPDLKLRPGAWRY